MKREERHAVRAHFRPPNLDHSVSFLPARFWLVSKRTITRAKIYRNISFTAVCSRATDSY